MDEGMPLAPYREQIIEFSEIYQFCQEFGMKPQEVRKWKEEEPYEYKCFQMFLIGMAKNNKGEKNDVQHTNRHTGKFR